MQLKIISIISETDQFQNASASKKRSERSRSLELLSEDVKPLQKRTHLTETPVSFPSTEDSLKTIFLNTVCTDKRYSGLAKVIDKIPLTDPKSTLSQKQFIKYMKELAKQNEEKKQSDEGVHFLHGGNFGKVSIAENAWFWKFLSPLEKITTENATLLSERVLPHHAVPARFYGLENVKVDGTNPESWYFQINPYLQKTSVKEFMDWARHQPVDVKKQLAQQLVDMAAFSFTIGFNDAKIRNPETVNILIQKEEDNRFRFRFVDLEDTFQEIDFNETVENNLFLNMAYQLVGKQVFELPVSQDFLDNLANEKTAIFDQMDALKDKLADTVPHSEPRQQTAQNVKSVVERILEKSASAEGGTKGVTILDVVNAARGYTLPQPVTVSPKELARELHAISSKYLPLEESQKEIGKEKKKDRPGFSSILRTPLQNITNISITVKA